MRPLPHVAARIFGEPLAIDRKKLEIIVQVVSPRLMGSAFDDEDDDDEDDETTPPRGYEVSDGIATININGTLVAKSSWMNAASGMTSYPDIASNFNRAMSDQAVGGIVLSIDSPGGEVAGMFELADAMYECRGQKPVCAFIQCATSAAYMLASTADQIIVSRIALVGSIGVIALHRDQSGADAQAGLSYTAIFSGARKNDGNPHAPLSAEATAALQTRVDQIAEMFSSDAARNRNLAPSAVAAMQAALYLGQAGIGVGLADAEGTFDDAFALVSAAIANGDRSLNARSAASAANLTKEKKRMTTPNAADAAQAAEAKKNFDAAVSAAAREGRESVSTIVHLCALAGHSELAAGFIEANKSPDEVRKELMAAKAAAGGPDIDTSLLPGGKQPEQQGKAKPWGDIFSALGAKK